MKGRKDEKIMDPLFPRLHINDTSRGGPRAPSRNKMALYEQISIPSQSCGTSRISRLLLHSNNGSILVPSAASSQAAQHERTVFSSFYIPPPPPAHLTDKLHSGSSLAVNLNPTMANFKRKSMKNVNCPSLNDSRRSSLTSGYGSLHPNDFSNSKNSCRPDVGDEDEVRLPAFVHSQITQSSSKYLNSINMDRNTQFRSSKPGCSKVISGNCVPKTAAKNTICSSMQLRNVHDKYLKRTNTTDMTSRQHGRNDGEENLNEYSPRKEIQKLAYSSNKENTDKPKKHTNTSLNQDHESNPVEYIEGVEYIDALLNQEYKAGLLLKDTACSNGASVDSEKRNVSMGDRESCFAGPLWNRHRIPNEAENGSNYCDDENACRSLPVGNMDRNDDSSETSVVKYLSGLEISPIDIVGAIGQKHFWRTKREMVNQQRLFVVQVFELHRLIQVQKLIAGSPHLVFEDNPYLGKPSLKVSSSSKLPSEYVLKSPPHIKAKDESQKPNHGPDSAVVKPSDPSPNENFIDDLPTTVLLPQINAKDESQKPSQDPNSAVVEPPDLSSNDDLNKRMVTQNLSYGQCSENIPAPPAATENKADPPWCFLPSPPGNQWLLPIMSPSEGLVYKPYTVAFPPTTGFMAPVYGGLGLMHVPSMEGGCLNPDSGFSGFSVLFGVSLVAQVSPPVTKAVKSGSPFKEGSSLSRARPDGKAEQLTTGEANPCMTSQSPSNILNKKGETISCVKKTETPRNGELQQTTASSPCERGGQGGTRG